MRMIVILIMINLSDSEFKISTFSTEVDVVNGIGGAVRVGAIKVKE